MVTRNKAQGARKKAAKKGRVAVGKLQLNKETVKNLSGGEAKKVKGGRAAASGQQTCSCERTLWMC